MRDIGDLVVPALAGGAFIGCFVLIGMAACSPSPERVSAPQQTQTSVEVKADPCTMPKYKVGELVHTVLKDEGYTTEGLVAQVFPDKDTKNQTCVYEVVHYGGGKSYTWKYWEFELSP